jgi:hypothetical protein
MAIFRGEGGSIDGLVTPTTIPVTTSQGGTGATTANAGLNNLLPNQGGQAGKYLKTDGTNTAWDALDLATSDVTGFLPVSKGGTGASNATEAQNNLGLEIGVDIPANDGTGATGTWAVDISGNAATVTDGLVSTGSYADPSWLTSVAGSKVSGDISGNAANVTGTVAVANGGTGATTSDGALTNLLPSYTGNGGKVLSVNTGATGVEWSPAGSGSVTSVAMSVPTGLSVSGSPITTDGTLAVTYSSGYAIPTTAKQTEWDTAYGWGDHATEGYLTSYTETDPVFTASEAASITSTDTSNWDTAYGWGNHASAGYLTSYTETDPVYTASTWYSTTNNASNWDTAYGWGNHASAGYLTSATAATTYVALAGSYANPTWITSLSETKVLPSQTGNNGKYLTTDGTVTSWATLNVTPALDDLSDVTITTPATDQVLKYDGSGWVNGAAPAGGQYFGTAAVKAIAYNSNTIAENITITSGNNAMSVGNLTISSGYSVTVESGCRWVVL